MKKLVLSLFVLVLGCTVSGAFAANTPVNIVYPIDANAYDNYVTLELSTTTYTGAATGMTAISDSSNTTLDLDTMEGVTTASAPDEAPPSWRAAVLDREATLGLVRVERSSTMFVYQLLAGLSTPARKIEGAVVWRYDGQAEFAYHPTRATAQFVRESARSQKSDRSDQLIGSVSVDEYGRRWVVERVDAVALETMLAAYQAQVEALYGPEPQTPQPQERSTPADDEDAAWVFWSPLAWNRTDCDGDGNDNIFAWDADSRLAVSNPMSIRHVKVLLLTSPAGSCSGTMVDDEWLLTAAHCVTDANGNEYSPSTITACTRGNSQAGAQCINATAVTTTGSWTGSGMSDDYAVVRLATSPGVGWMALSQASDATIRNATGYNVGYPGFKPTCTANLPAPMVAGELARTGYSSSGDVIGHTATRIKTRLDIGTGHSGGPFYYYPNGCCGAHYLTGVVSGYVETIGDNYNGGPKSLGIYAWVTAVTP